MNTKPLAVAVFCALAFHLSVARAGQVDVPKPPLSARFGSAVAVLSNGNYVIADSDYDAPGPIPNVGAIHLYDGTTLTLISTLTGSSAGDRVGSGGITVLSNGNYVVNSPFWNNGPVNRAGAATWCNGTTGTPGIVTSANSLVGSTALDQVGSQGVTALKNGNYVVESPNWNNGPALIAGAVTWGNGTIGTTGIVSAANSLVGSTVNDRVGLFDFQGLVELANGNYVVISTFWNNGAATQAGAVTWCNGAVGTTGVVSAANSLVGGNPNDFVGAPNVTALLNGHYVVASRNWGGGFGAATWCNGNTGRTGVVAVANSLIGGDSDDFVGILGIVALANSNYVVRSSSFGTVGVNAGGAVTWGNGTIGTTGVVSALNSLLGNNLGDSVGVGGVLALSNGNYVVASPLWDIGTNDIFTTIANAGAVTWCDGTLGRTGFVSAVNSLIGTTSGDQIGGGTLGGNGLIAVGNGSYVVASPGFDKGAIANAGAVTWCNGTTGLTGAVSAANSLVGSTAGDQVGFYGVTALPNGNYVANSPYWNNGGSLAFAGAVTWCDGNTGRTGVISAANSFVGDKASQLVGSGDEKGAIALANGNYVVNVPFWNDGISFSQGAVAWCNGTVGRTGSISAANSLIGGPVDQVGTYVTALSNGNYLVRSPSWNNGAGAITLANGSSGMIGMVSSNNSLVSGSAFFFFGQGSVTGLNNGSYILYAPNSGPMLEGLILSGNGTTSVTGILSNDDFVSSLAENGGAALKFVRDVPRDRILVGDSQNNRAVVVGLDASPEIAVQQPANVHLTNGATRSFGATLGQNATLTFTILNQNVGDLSGVNITIDGPHAGQFSVTASPATNVAGLASTTFTVQFAATNMGIRTAVLHIASNDTDENPFNINLSGQTLTSAQDTDGDGLNDAAEFELRSLGFDWQANQPGLVNTYFANANAAGLYTASQVQALNVGTPLLTKNPTNNQFTLTIGVQQSMNLINFTPFPMSAPQTLINGSGNLEFQFAGSNNAAFYRLESH